MKIIINETQLNNIVKQDIDEKLGVPTNIESVAKDFYNKLLEQLEIVFNPTDVIRGDSTKKIYLDLDDKINDMLITDVKIELMFNDVDVESVETVSLAYGHTSNVSKNGGEYVRTAAEPDVSSSGFMINFYIPKHKETTIQDIINHLVSEDNRIITSLSHELKHMYDFYKKRKMSVDKSSDYAAYNSNIRFGPNTLDSFLMYMYFTNNAENLTRATETYTSAIEKHVTKKQFLDFLKDNQTYNVLVNCRDFKLDNVFNDLKTNHLDRIKEQLIRGKHVPVTATDDEIILKVFEIAYVALANKKLDDIKRAITQFDINHLVATIFGGKVDDGDAERYFNKIANRLQTGKKNAMVFFRKMEKHINYTGNNMLRKISKVYDMLPD
jgi:hypothetical protein